MTETLYPLVFRSVCKEYIWGGTRIAQKYHRMPSLNTCAESWEIADRPEGESIVSQGPLQGCPLHQLIADFGPELLGTASRAAVFPLLIKLIDAKQSLSIQVHPSEDSSHRYGGEAKTEAWYILDAEPGAAVYAGFKESMTPAALEQTIKEGTLPSHLNRIEVKNGDVILISGGRVHAIDKGSLLLEVQQNSNTTFRIFDWNRYNPDGSQRELHIAQALQHIDWTDHASARISPSPSIQLTEFNESTILVQTDYFTIHRHRLTGTYPVPADSSCFRILFVEKGTMAVQYKTTTILQPGCTCLLPAGLPGGCRIAPLSGCSTYLSITPA